MITDNYIRVIVGPVHAEKTTTLIRALSLYRVGEFRIQAFKSAKDNRYDSHNLATHDGVKFPATPVESIGELVAKLESDTEVIGIDEAQFFGAEVVLVAHDLARQRGRVVIASALDRDYRGYAFPLEGRGTVGDLMAIADDLDYRTALCTAQENGNSRICGRDAAWSQRFIDGQVAPASADTVKVGVDDYQPRCGKHFVRLDGYAGVVMPLK